MSKRCQCCHKYAPKAVLGTDGDGKVIHGEPPGQCRGNASIEEARYWARIWKARAQRAGWGKNLTEGGKKAADAIAEQFKVIDDAAVECAPASVTGTNTDEYAPSNTPQEPSPGDGTQIRCATNLARCQNGHSVRVGSPMHEQMLDRGCFHCGAFPEVA